MAALIFDLDGTLVDTVYAHVLAWQLAFAEAGIPIDGWRLHRRMGMSGSRIYFLSVRRGWAWKRTTVLSSEMRFGICWRRVGPGCSASASSAAVMARMNWRGLGPSASFVTPPSCTTTWTNSAYCPNGVWRGLG